MSISKPALYIAFIFLIAAFFRLWRLGEPPFMYFDENIHATGAEDVRLGHKSFDDQQPPLAPLIMAASLAVFSHERWVPLNVPTSWRSATSMGHEDALCLLDENGRKIWRIDLARLQQLPPLDLSRPAARLFQRNDGHNLYALSADQKDLIIFNLQGRVRGRTPLPFVPDDILPLPAQNLVVLVAKSAGHIAVVRFNESDIVWQRRLQGALGDVVFQPPPPPPKHDPLKLEMPPKEKDDSSAKDYVPSLFLAATAEGTVYHLRLRDGAILNRVRVWGRPVHLALIYREVFSLQVLLIIDAASKTFSAVPLPLSVRGKLPPKRGKPISALGMTPDAGRVYVATPQYLYVINPFWWRIAQRLKLPHPVDGVFASRDGRHLILTDSSTGKVFGVDLGNRYGAWRLPGVVFALLLFAVCGLMAQAAGRSRFEVAAVLVLLACDPLLFALSRMAMNDIYLAAFVVGAYYFCFRYTQSPNKRAFFWAMSICFGLGLASKWPAVCALGGTFLCLAVAYFLGEMREGRILSRLSPEARSVLSEVYLCLVVAAFVWLYPELTALSGDFAVSHRLSHPWVRGWIPVLGRL